MADVLTIREAVQRAKREGLPVSEYSLRGWVKSGSIPVRVAGHKALIFYPNLVSFLRCDDGSDNTLYESQEIRKVSLRQERKERK